MQDPVREARVEPDLLPALVRRVEIEHLGGFLQDESQQAVDVGRAQPVDGLMSDAILVHLLLDDVDDDPTA